jgi:hypothetical protein
MICGAWRLGIVHDDFQHVEAYLENGRLVSLLTKG